MLNAEKLIVLDFGCKTEKCEGAIGVDIDPTVNPDVVHDFNVFPYPFKDNYADKIYAKHIIEHLDNPKKFIEEIYRILKPGGIVFIETPHFSNYVAYAEPQHKLFYSYFMFREIMSGVRKNIEVLQWKLTFYRTFRFVGVQALANKFPVEYERFWTYMFPAENIVLKFKKI
ncbi:MAG: class I SAM-dependent methyltransferase [PVC group bacterium]|nr:class I SAM-dependent methyltransferase [PVC group bacterium]